MRLSIALTLFLAMAPSFADAQAQRIDLNDPVQKMFEEKERSDNRNPFDLPPYNVGDTTAFGEVKTYVVGEQDTLHDIARHYDLGFVELRAANQGVDAWAPAPGTELLLPKLHILPRAPQDGIIINLAEMRFYYFKDGADVPVTFPIGIGREGLETPVGQTTIVRKKEGPSWTPTPRMREENPDLPVTVPPGPSNPLGTHALYLGWPAFLVHGTNKPSGIGRRVSSGCIRMLPEHITQVFSMVPTGTNVTVVDQPIKSAMVNDDLYLEVNPTGEDVSEIELVGRITPVSMTPDAPIVMPEGLKRLIASAVGDKDVVVDWDAVAQAYAEKKAYPVKVGALRADTSVETEGEAEVVEETPVEEEALPSSAPAVRERPVAPPSRRLNQ